MAKATVTVAGRTSRPASQVRGASAPTRNSLVDRPFLRPMLVRKVKGSGTDNGRRPVEKAALVVVDNQFMVVAPTNTGEPAVYVGRKAADEKYVFVRYLTPSEQISFPGIAG